MKYSSAPLIVTVLIVVFAAVGYLTYRQQSETPRPVASLEQGASQAENTPKQPAVPLPAQQSQGTADGGNARPLPAAEGQPPVGATLVPDQNADPDTQLAISDDAYPVGAENGDADDTLVEGLPGEQGTDSVTSDGKQIITGTVAKGDTAAVLLNTWLPSNEVYSLLDITRNVYSLAQIHEGQPYTVVRNEQSGEMESFEYEIDNNRKLVVSREQAGLEARVEDIAYDTRLSMVTGSITSNLFASMTDIGEQPSLVMIIADIFAWEINFIKDVREGDSFSILVEKRYRDGEFRNYGRVLAATFTSQGTKFEAFRFADGQGHYRFFNAKGESLEKTLLKAPLPITRVTSGYSMSRLHPIFKNRRPHQGVDYGAPHGTPIKAVGSGVITVTGWVGGYGKQVVVRHSGRLESMYSHMSRFGKGIKPGTKVRQGQIIGYVGATGNATGPHLDFRLKQNGSFVNPTKVINPRVDDLPKKNMGAFTEQSGISRAYMTGTKDLQDYKPQ